MSSKQLRWLLLSLILFETYEIRAGSSKKGSESSIPEHKPFTRIGSTATGSSTSRARSQKTNNKSNSDGLYLRLKNPFLGPSGFAKQARQFLNQEKYPQAIRYYTKAIKRKPKDEPSYYRMRGHCYTKTGDLNNAIKDFRTVLSMIPDNQDDRRILIQALYDAERYKQAVDETVKFDDFEELMKLGDNLSSIEKFPEAARSYTEAIKRAPSDVELGNLAEKLYSMKKFQEAILCYTEAIEKNSSQVLHYMMRAKVYTKVGNLDMAIQDYQKGLELDPRDNDHRVLLKRLLLESGRYNEAIDETILMGDTQDLMALGKKLFFKEKFQESVRCYTEVINKYPSAATPRKVRGRCYIEMGDLDMAILDFKEAIQVDPDNQECCYFFIRALFDSGKFDQAIRESLASDSTVLMAILADELAFEKKFEEAIHCYNHMIEKNPSETSYLRKRGLCHSKMENLDMAMIDLKSAVEIDSSNRRNFLFLIKTLLNFERFNEAIEETLNLGDTNELAKLGDKLFFMEKFEEALRCYTLAINKRHDEASYYKSRGKYYLEMKDLEAAASDFKNAVQIDPLNEENCRLFIRTLFECGKFDEAVEESLKLDSNTVLITILSNELVSENRIEEAIRCYTELINKNSSDATNYELRGSCYVKMGNTFSDMAIADFKDAIQLDPSNKDYPVLLIQALFASGRFEEAIEESLNLKTDLSLLKSMADGLITERKFEEAIRFYSEMINKAPSEASYYKLRGKCYLGMENVNAAVADFRDALLIDSTDAEYFNLLIQTLLASGRIEEVIAEILKLNDMDELIQLADKLFLEGKFEDAMHCYTALIEKEPTEAGYYKQRGICYSKMKNTDTALSDLKKAAELDPKDTRIPLHVIEVLFNSERYTETVEELLNLNDDQITGKLAHELYLKGKYEEAIRCYSAVIEKNPSDAVSLSGRGDCYQSMNNWKHAVDDYKKALEINPNRRYFALLIRVLFDAERFDEAVEETLVFNDIEELSNVGDRLLDGEKFEEAIRCYTAAINKNTKNATYYCRRGRCFWRLQNLKMAIDDFETALKLPVLMSQPFLSASDCRIDLVDVLFEAGRYEDAKKALIDVKTSDLRDEQLERVDKIRQKIREAIGIEDEVEVVPEKVTGSEDLIVMTKAVTDQEDTAH